MAASTCGAVVGRLLRDDGGVAEGHHPQPDRRRLLGHEGPGRGLGRVEPGGREVLGRHARRHVEGEDDGALAPRFGNRRRRAGQGGQQEGQGGEQQDGRDVAPPVRSPGGGGDQALGRQLCPALVAAAQLGPVGDHQDGDREQGQQQHRPLEAHRRLRLRSSEMRARALTRSSSVATGWISVPDRRAAATRASCRSAGGRREPLRGTPGRWCRRRSARRSRRPRRRPSPPPGSSVSRGSTTWMATTSCRRASSDSGCSQPGWVMKSETMMSSERRRARPEGGAEQPGQVGGVLRRGRRWAAAAGPG